MARRATGIFLILALSLAPLLSGCGSGETSSSGGATMDDLATTLDKPEPIVDSGASEGSAATAEVNGATDAAPPPDDQSAVAGSEESSNAGDGRQVAGRAPIGEGGYFVAIGGARRHILNRIEDLAWTQAVQHFKATEGRLPRDNAEFMTRIVEEHGIDLGYKEEDQEFLYDPNEGPWGTVFVVAKEPATE